MFILANNNYKEFDSIPLLLNDGNHEKAVALSRRVLKNVLKEELTCAYAWYMLGLVYLHWAYFCEDNVGGLAIIYFKRAARYINIAMNKENYPNLQEGDFGDEYLDKYKRYREKRGENIDSLHITKDNVTSHLRVLSRIYMILSRVSWGDGVDINISHLNKSVECDPYNTTAYRRLQSYYDDMGREEDKYLLLIKWLKIMPDSMSAIENLWPVLYNKKEYMKAAQLLYKGFTITYKNYQDIAKPDEDPMWRDELHNKYIEKYIQANAMLFLAYLRENKHEDAMDSLSNALLMAGKKINEYKTAVHEENIDVVHFCVMIRNIFDIDNNKLLECRTIDDVYSYVSYINKYTSGFYKYIKDLADTDLNISLWVIIAKRLHVSVLYFALSSKNTPKAKLMVKDIICMFSELVFMQLLNSVNTVWETSRDTVLVKYIEDINANKGRTDAEISFLFQEVCNLIRHIYRKYDLSSQVESVNALENFIINLYRHESIDNKKNEMILLNSIKTHLTKYGHSTVNISIDSIRRQIEEGFRNLPGETAQAVIATQKGDKNVTTDTIKLKIDFSKEKTIEVNNRAYKIKKTREYLLLEELLNSKDKEIHWSYGFVLFNSWRNKVPKNSIRSFQGIVSILNKILGPEAVAADKNNENRLWHFTKGIKIERNSIDEANNLCKEAVECKSKDQAIGKITQAVMCYPESITVNNIFIDIVYKVLETSDINSKIKGMIISANRILVTRKMDLLAAINVIQENAYKNYNEQCWGEVGLFLEKMANELENIQVSIAKVNSLLTPNIVGEETAECMALCEMMNHMKHNTTNDLGHDYYMSYIVKINIVSTIIMSSCKEIMKKIKSRFKDIDEQKVKRLAITSLWEHLIDKGLPPFDKKATLFSYLKKTIVYRVQDEILLSYFNIKPSESNDIRQISRVKEEYYKEYHREPSSLEILNKLDKSWYRERLERAYINEGMLKGKYINDEKWAFNPESQEIIFFNDKPLESA